MLKTLSLMTIAKAAHLLSIETNHPWDEMEILEIAEGMNIDLYVAIPADATFRILVESSPRNFEIIYKSHPGEAIGGLIYAYSLHKLRWNGEILVDHALTKDDLKNLAHGRPLEYSGEKRFSPHITAGIEAVRLTNHIYRQLLEFWRAPTKKIPHFFLPEWVLATNPHLPDFLNIDEYQRLEATQDWKEFARIRAFQICRRTSANEFSPTKKSVAAHIVNELAARGLKSDRGTTPSPNSVIRDVLTPEYWKTITGKGLKGGASSLKAA